MIHRSRVYSLFGEETAMAPGARVKLLCTIPEDIILHWRWGRIGTSESPIRVELFEDTVVVDPGQVLTSHGCNRVSREASQVVVTLAPTVQITGTRLLRTTLWGDRLDLTSPRYGPVVYEKPPAEYIWSNTTVMLKITNTSTQTIQLDFGFSWYELDDNFIED